jgi:hypothetical protein
MTVVQSQRRVIHVDRDACSTFFGLPPDVAIHRWEFPKHFSLGHDCRLCPSTNHCTGIVDVGVDVDGTGAGTGTDTIAIVSLPVKLIP